MSKPFDLQEALAGKPVETVSGKPVTQLKTFELADGGRCLFGVINDNVWSWFSNGTYGWNAVIDAPNDLRMTTVKKVYFYNMWSRKGGYWSCPGPGVYHFFTGPFFNSEQAESDSRNPGTFNLSGKPKNPRTFVRTIEIVVEE